MKALFYTFLFIPLASLFSQEKEKKNDFSGYVSLMGSNKTEYSDSIYKPGGSFNHSDFLIHNRLNFFYYPSPHLEISVQMRNRFMWDETIKNNPYFFQAFEHDAGYLQLSKNILEEKNSVFNTSIDRLYVKYTLDNLEVTLGRQRINWSQTFAWNPNDIFNASNYFDFDYAEKPGSDALRITWYTGMASSAEAVVKIDNLQNITAAALYKHNIKGYDIQFLSGIMNEEEFVLGTGWTGNILNAGFRGEVTAILPFKDSSDYFHAMNNLWMVSTGFDYSFGNSSYLMVEVLYSNNNLSALSGGFNSFFGSPVTVRNLAFARLSALTSYSYPVHPLINLNLAAMAFYRINGFYIGPSADFSLGNNLSLSAYWQYFYMFLSKEKEANTSDISLNYLFCRLKYNF